MDDKTILIIEDDEMNMKLVRSVLQLEKYRILEAKSAEKGIQLAREHHPNLILMDIKLPGMNGLAATRVIKDDPDLNGIPVVALTSYGMDGDEEKAFDAGCAGYIAKPIDTKTFQETIGQILSAYSAKYFQ